MKITFLVLLLAFCLNNLTATSEEETSGGLEEVLPVFAFNREALVKPAETACMQWLELLEIERNKADTLGNFQAFKAFTKEISATIGGKYGFSIPSTHEETIALSYSIIRTRHKFCGKRNMLSDFYGVGAVADDLEIQHYLSLVLAIDTMAAKAINDEDDTFFDQWTAVSQTGSTHDFIEAVRNHTQSQEKSSLFTALDGPLTAVLTDRETIATVKDVFDIFAPKITLKKIYTEMIGGEYRGWTIHGADAFAYPISLHPDDVAQNPELESNLRNELKQQLAEGKDRDVFFCSSVSSLTSDGSQYQLEYVYDELMPVYKLNLRGIEPRLMTLSRAANPNLLGISSIKSSRLSTLAIYKNMRGFLSKRDDEEAKAMSGWDKLARLNRHVKKHAIPPMLVDWVELYRREYGEEKAVPCDELIWLISCGHAEAMNEYAKILHKDINEENLERAVNLCREAADLGDKNAKESLPIYLAQYSVELSYDTSKIEKAIELCRESAFLGSEHAEYNLPLFLFEHGKCLFNGQSGFEKNVLQAIQLFRESRDLGNRKAEINLSICLESYINNLFYGQDGIDRNVIKAIELCRKMANCFEKNNAEQQLPIYLFNYGVWLYNGEEGIIKDIPNSIKILKKSADLKFEKAKNLLPSIMFNYAIWLHNGENDIAQDMEKAVNFCKESAGLDCEKAKNLLPAFIFNYGMSLFRGENGIKQDFEKATVMFMESAKLGHEEAELILKELQDFIKRDNADMREKFSIRNALSGFRRFSDRRAWIEFDTFNGFLKLDDIIDEVLEYAGVAQVTKKPNDKQSWISDGENEEDDDEF